VSSNLIKVKLSRDDALTLRVELGHFITTLIRDERMAVKSLIPFGSDSIGGDHRNDVGYGVPNHRSLPRIFRLKIRRRRLAANRRRIEKNVSALKHHRARALGKPLIPANTHADRAETS